jgi:hypothetical protein
MFPTTSQFCQWYAAAFRETRHVIFNTINDGNTLSSAGCCHQRVLLTLHVVINGRRTADNMPTLKLLTLDAKCNDDCLRSTQENTERTQICAKNAGRKCADAMHIIIIADVEK